MEWRKPGEPSLLRTASVQKQARLKVHGLWDHSFSGVRVQEHLSHKTMSLPKTLQHVGPCLGAYGGPIGGTVSYQRGTPAIKENTGVDHDGTSEGGQGSGA